MLQVVAVAVVEGEGDKSPAEILLRKSAMHLVETDELDAPLLQPDDHPLEKPRFHFQEPVGLESPARAGRTWCSVRMAPTPP